MQHGGSGSNPDHFARPVDPTPYFLVYLSETNTSTGIIDIAIFCNLFSSTSNVGL